jgi:hypothetical protein
MGISVWNPVSWKLVSSFFGTQRQVYPYVPFRSLDLNFILIIVIHAFI